MEQAKKYEVKIYYSGFCTYKVEAINENEALEKGRFLAIDNNELLSSLEHWKDADEAIGI